MGCEDSHEDGGVTRPARDQTWMAVASIISQRSTCARRKVGCVLINVWDQVASTGYNGVASGSTHCINQPCAGADEEPGAGLDLCEAIHAEQNALLQCTNPQSLKIAYITCAPCVHCVKMLLNTSCRTIVHDQSYAHEAQSKALWVRAGRLWRQSPVTVRYYANDQ